MSVAVIIPAAGSGSRFGGTMPKQYLPLRAMPILVRTVGIFAALPEVTAIVLAVNEDMIGVARDMIEQYYPRRVFFTSGGGERQESIFKALHHEAVEFADYVCVHDAVRPLATAKLFRSVLDAAREFGAAVPGLMPKETIKQLTRDGFVEQTYTRSLLSAVQTPQVFERSLLVEAYTEAMQDRFIGTDDASLVEYFGTQVRVVQGEEDNIKITTQLDFRLAELILSSRMV